MINLLPPEEKEKLCFEKKKRMVIILWILTLFFLFCLVLILFSTKIYLASQVKSQKNLLSALQKEFGQSEIQELQEKINSANLTLTKLNSFYQKKIYSPEILEKIVQVFPGELYLTNLSVVFSSDQEKGRAGVSLSGFAPDREILFELKKNLEEESDCKDIYFPPANWVKSADINFSATFKIGNK